MPSISHRASLGQIALRRAKSGLAVLPAGFVRAVIRLGCAWMEVALDLHQFEKHVMYDVGFQLRSGRRSHDPERPAADLPPGRGRTPNRTRTQKED